MFQQVFEFFYNIYQRLTSGADRRPIADINALVEFLHTRASYNAQIALYGYLKTRMGTSYRHHFEDDRYAASIRIAAVKIALACLEDLTVFAAAELTRQCSLTAAQTAALAGHCYDRALAEMIEGDDRQHLPGDAAAAFSRRIEATDWDKAVAGENAFTRSPRDLVDFAPVSDEYKKLDREIVMNSLRFRWREVRERFRKRLVANEVCADWRAQNTTGQPAR